MKPVLTWRKRGIKPCRATTGRWWLEAEVKGFGMLEVWPMAEPRFFRFQIPALRFVAGGFESREQAMIAAEKYIATIADSINAALSRKT